MKDVIHGDYRKAILFLRGMSLDEDNASLGDNDYVKALMIDKRMFDDPFVRRSIYNLIKHRITEAKIGVIGVHGNYSIMSGDPYALCQSIFGMEITGILKAGEIYNKYWVDDGAKCVACFRAPMSNHNNIVKRAISRCEDSLYWYRYMNTCTVVNAWDSTCQALNGADFDGDLIFTTDNNVLVDNIRETRTIFCPQRKATKRIVTEEDLMESNISSFGDDIGKTTNYITSMYDVQSGFPPESPEYKTLDYRIMSGQKLQQDCIDRVKGIVCKPMPKGWHDFHGNALPDNPTEEDRAKRAFNLRILADKKPYFMRYIYADIMSQYNTYMKNTEAKCESEFRVTIDELLAMNEKDRTPKQNEFIGYYLRRIPVSMGDCVANRICRKVEQAFDHILMMNQSTEFDYSILKSGCEYTNDQYRKVMEAYREYTEIAAASASARTGAASRTIGKNRCTSARDEFVKRCLSICSNAEQLCDIIVDICYKRSTTKQFAWDICGEEIINNLLRRNDGKISYPKQDEAGDIEYGGQRFSFCRSDYHGEYCLR